MFHKWKWLGVASMLAVGPLLGLGLELETDRVVVRDHSGAGIAIVGVQHQSTGQSTGGVVRHARVVEGDLALETEIGPESVWVAVDLGTGDYTIHAPEAVVGSTLYTPEFQGSALRYFDRLGLLGGELDLVVVRKSRKGVAVWHGRFFDQGATGRNSANWIDGSITSLVRLNSGKGKLNRLQNGDLAIGFDAATLEHFAVEIGD